MVGNKDAFGLLVGNGNELLYVPFEGGLEALLKREKPIDISEGKNCVYVGEFSGRISSVLATDSEIYVGLLMERPIREDSKIFYKWIKHRNWYGGSKYEWESLVDRLLIGPNDYFSYVSDIVLFGDKVFAVGSNKFFYDANGNRVVPYEDLHNKKIKDIYGIAVDGNELFLSFKDRGSIYCDPVHKLISIIHEDNTFKFGDVVYDYGRDIYLRKNILFPTIRSLGKWGINKRKNKQKGKSVFVSTGVFGDLTILIYDRYDKQVYNKRVVNSEVPYEGGAWYRLGVINNNLNNKIAEILVGGRKVSEKPNSIWYMKINYGYYEPEVIRGEKFPIITGLSDHIFGFDIVRNEKLHNELMKLKR